MHKTMRSLLFPLFIACSTLIVGCGSSVPVIKPFKMEIQQGNVVTSKMLLQLRPGMTKSQVKFIMGTPLVIDSFHTNRWDYFYQLRQAGKVVEQRRVILDFEKDLLARVRGDVVPQGTPGADTGAVVLSKEPAPAAAKPAEKEGILENLKFWKDSEAPKNGETPEAKPSTESITPESKSVTNEIAPNDAVKHEPASEMTAPVNESPEALPAAETPSMLAVPIPIAPVEDAPVIESKPTETKPVVAPAEAIPAADLPVKSGSPAKQDEERIFRLDRNLDAKNIDSSNAAQEPAKNTSKPAEQPNAAEGKPQPDEEEPGYFERMLEKIGF